MKRVLKQMAGIICMGLAMWVAMCVLAILFDWVGAAISSHERVIVDMDDIIALCAGWGIFVGLGTALALSDEGMYPKEEKEI